MVKELELEIGMLKSEEEETLDQVKIIKTKAESPKRVGQNEYDSIVKPKKEWLKDELIAAQDKQIKEMEANRCQEFFHCLFHTMDRVPFYY